MIIHENVFIFHIPFIRTIYILNLTSLHDFIDLRPNTLFYRIRVNMCVNVNNGITTQCPIV